MARYNPNPSGVVRDQTNAAEIAGHRPILATRIVSEADFEERDPLHSLRGQPDELYEDESYHHGMNVDKFNEQLRGGHAGRNDSEE